MNKKLVSIVMSAATLVSGAVLADCDPQFYVGAELQAGHKRGAKEVRLKSKNNVNTSTLTGISKKGTFKTDPAPSAISKSANGATLFVGSRLNENLGLELGGTVLRTQKANNITNVRTGLVMPGSAVSIKNSNVYADAMGYLPIDCATDLIGSVGIGHLSTKVNYKTVAKPTSADQKFSAKATKVGVRLGVGAQYKFTENVGARVMVRYQQGNKIVKKMTSAGLGMFYQF